MFRAAGLVYGSRPGIRIDKDSLHVILKLSLKP